MRSDRKKKTASIYLVMLQARLQAKQVTTGDKRVQYKGLNSDTINGWYICSIECVRCVISDCSGTLDAILKMIRYEGLHGFYKGMSTKIVQSVLAAAVLFMVKEELVKTTRFLLTSTPNKKLK